MAAVLILFAHPALEKSRVHAQLIKEVNGINGVTFHDLYEAYPDYDINVQQEQALLVKHDIIIWQHPFYWYSSPAIVKQWLDLVLEHGWAYGTNGHKLAGKMIFNAITCGGPREAYSTQGRNRFEIRQLLAPFDQTAHLCGMQYLPPFVVHGTHKIGKKDIDASAAQYRTLLVALTNDKIPAEQWQRVSYLNDVTLIPENFNK
jgi:glutathione-regulated potassium-efflux system ancillary protein KefG